MSNPSKIKNAQLPVDRFASLEGLPPFPGIAMQIMTECEKPDSSAKHVIPLIECDPAIGIKVLELANSPLYGSSRPITTIAHSVVLLGFQAVSNLAISVAVSGAFEEGDSKHSNLRNDIFRQSIACATTSRVIAKTLNTSGCDEAFFSGIVHDIGKLVLLKTVPDLYLEVLANIPFGNSTFLEDEFIGITHTQLGETCGKKWRLPATINFAIANHHNPLDDSQNELVNTLILANYMIGKWGIGFDNAQFDAPLIEEIEQFVSSEIQSDIRKTCTDQYEAVIEICSK